MPQMFPVHMLGLYFMVSLILCVFIFQLFWKFFAVSNMCQRQPSSSYKANELNW